MGAWECGWTGGESERNSSSSFAVSYFLNCFELISPTKAKLQKEEGNKKKVGGKKRKKEEGRRKKEEINESRRRPSGLGTHCSPVTQTKPKPRKSAA